MSDNKNNVEVVDVDKANKIIDRVHDAILSNKTDSKDTRKHAEGCNKDNGGCNNTVIGYNSAVVSGCFNVVVGIDTIVAGNNNSVIGNYLNVVGDCNSIIIKGNAKQMSIVGNRNTMCPKQE